MDFAEVKAMMGEMGSFVEKFNLEDKELEKLSCTLLNRKTKGVLRLKTHGLTF